MIIAVCGLKGGVGKTTTTLALSGAFCAWGQAPLLLDLDPGRTLSLWSKAAREGGHPSPVSLALQGDLAHPARIRELARGFALTLVDAPGQLTTATATAMAAADLVLLPCSPDAADVWALGRALELAGDLRRAQGHAPRLLALPARYDRRRRGEVARLRDTLGEWGLPLTRAGLPLRADHARALAAGQPVHDLAPSSAAAAEASALSRELLRHLLTTQIQAPTVRH